MAFTPDLPPGARPRMWILVTLTVIGGGLIYFGRGLVYFGVRSHLLLAGSRLLWGRPHLLLPSHPIELKVSLFIPVQAFPF